MRITMTLPDDLYDSYAQMAERTQGKAAAEDCIAAQLERFRRVPATDRIIVVDAHAREALEELLGGSQIPTGAVLVERVAFLAEIKIGTVKVNFTPEQMAELKRRATRSEIPLEAYLRDVVRDMEWRFFDSISAG